MEKKTIITNFIWRFFERIGAQGVNFIVSLILARLLLPEDYGTISLVTVFISILNVFVDSGLANSLIQKKDADDVDFSSVFYFNIVWSIMLYGMLFMIAPYISAYYARTELTLVIRVLGMILIFSGIKNVQQAYVSKTMQFKRFFFSTIGGTIFSAIVGIYMAFKGFGVWALVFQYLLNSVIGTVILWITVKWRPSLAFSGKRLIILAKYGWKLLASGLLDTIYNNISSLIIGKKYTTTDLAYYNKGNSLPTLIITNINSAIDSILFPVMSNKQDDLKQIKKMTRLSIRLSSFIIWPAVIGLAVCSKNIIEILLTAKWLPCVPYLIVFSISYGFWPIHTANLNAIKAIGRSDIFLKLEIIKKLIGLSILLVSINYGAFAIAVSVLVSAPICAFVNSYPNKKLLKYNYIEQLSDILPSLLMASCMGLIVNVYNYFSINIYLSLILQVLSGVIVYIVLASVTKNDSYMMILNIVKNKLKKGRY